MAEWRFARGWSDDELERRLDEASTLDRNFSQAAREMTAARGWSRHYSEAAVAHESPGPPVPGGDFMRAWHLIEGYAFSDPRIVKAHFDPDGPLRGRRMLLEAHVLGLRYLGAVVVAEVRDEEDTGHSVRGYRYDTLAGHFERGSEWFLVTKEHASGEIRFRIHAAWRPGDLPNWWSRLGFRLMVRRYQRAWHRLAHMRLRSLLGSTGLAPLPRRGRLVHAGADLPLAPIKTVAGPRRPADIAAEEEQIPEPRVQEAS